MRQSSGKDTPATRALRQQPPIAWAGSIGLVVGLVLIAFGAGLLTNDRYVIGWVLIALGCALVLGGAVALKWKLRPGAVSSVVTDKEP